MLEAFFFKDKHSLASLTIHGHGAKLNDINLVCDRHTLSASLGTDPTKSARTAKYTW